MLVGGNSRGGPIGARSTCALYGRGSIDQSSDATGVRSGPPSAQSDESAAVDVPFSVIREACWAEAASEASSRVARAYSTAAVRLRALAVLLTT